jgi:response regulator RpfG family c-di-GMP phosphodiesterase
MDGHQFLNELKNRSLEHPIPLIFLTARDSVEEKIGSLQEGAVHYITKPFNEWYRTPRASPGPGRLRLRCRPKGRGISPYVPCTHSVMDQ